MDRAFDTFLGFEQALDVSARACVLVYELGSSQVGVNDNFSPMDGSDWSPVVRFASIDAERAFAAAWELLTPDEVARAERYHHAKDRRLFVFARALIRAALARQTGQDPADLVLTRSAQGKPFIEGFGADLHFNLSYRGAHIALALSARPVGVDIERLPLAVDPVQVASRFFSMDERAYVFSDARDVERRFARIWTRQEAVLKLLGHGLARLGRYDVTPDGVRFSQDECASECHLHSLLGDDYALSVAA